MTERPLITVLHVRETNEYIGGPLHEVTFIDEDGTKKTIITSLCVVGEKGQPHKQQGIYIGTYFEQVINPRRFLTK
jgi:hypothetical protein